MSGLQKISVVHSCMQTIEVSHVQTELEHPLNNGVRTLVLIIVAVLEQQSYHSKVMELLENPPKQ